MFLTRWRLRSEASRVDMWAKLRMPVFWVVMVVLSWLGRSAVDAVNCDVVSEVLRGVDVVVAGPGQRRYQFRVTGAIPHLEDHPVGVVVGRRLQLVDAGHDADHHANSLSL